MDTAAPMDRGIRVREAIPLRGMRKMAAEHLTRTHAQVAAVTAFGEAEATALVALRRRLAADPVRPGAVRVTYTALLVQAVARALSRHPLLNAALAEDGGEILVYDEINVGVAVALPDGNLIVPVIHGADALALVEIATRVLTLAERARRGALTPPEVRRGTFTLSNVGMVPGVRWATPLVNLPQAAILAAGRIEPRPVIRDGAVAVAPVLPLSLTYDHRIVNGLPAGQFLETLLGVLAEPESMNPGFSPSGESPTPR
jgi:pyruvate dehydrogenase E2 component (dihydrolipoamide acetyltransferase)